MVMVGEVKNVTSPFYSLTLCGKFVLDVQFPMCDGTSQGLGVSETKIQTFSPNSCIPVRTVKSENRRVVTFIYLSCSEGI